MTDQTRFKYGLIFCGMVLVEGLLKHFLSGFPFDMAVAVQGGALGVYTVAKSTTNTLQAKLAADCVQNGAPKP